MRGPQSPTPVPNPSASATIKYVTSVIFSALLSHFVPSNSFTAFRVPHFMFEFMYLTDIYPDGGFVLFNNYI